jgi:hypothetical protein
MSVTFPNETPEYRAARAALLAREVALRREMEAVAAMLRALPPGGEVPEDYLFDCIGGSGCTGHPTHFSSRWIRVRTCGIWALSSRFGRSSI